MRGHQKCSLVILEEFLQPDQAFQIQMVARFVKQHDVGAHQQDAGKRHAHLPATRQLTDIAVHHLLREAQARQHFARPAVKRIAVQLLVTRLHLAVALDDRIHLVQPVGIDHGGFELTQFGGNDADRTGTVHHLGDGAAAFHFADILVEIANRDALLDGHLPLVGLLFAGDHPEDGRLSRAIGTDKPDLLALVEGGGRLDEENAVAQLLADIFDTDHVCGAQECCGALMPRVSGNVAGFRKG